MKNIIQIILLVGLLFTSCADEFLDIPAQGSLSEEVLKTKQGVDNLLIGAYRTLNGVVSGAGSAWETASDNWIYGSIAGGDAHKGSFGGDQPAIDPIMKFSADGSNGFFNSKWKAGYDGIMAANSVLKLIPEIDDMTEADRKDIEGQARFLRAHFYFDLKKMFNKIPWIDENTVDYNQPNDQDIWPLIEKDFEFAFENLSSTQSDVGRVNKWAAGAYLGKTYLYQKKFTESKRIFDSVIEEGNTSNGLKYGLVDRFTENFDAATKNNKESVFAVQMTANDGSNSIANSNQGGMIAFPGGSAPFRRDGGFHQPSIDLVNSFRTDDNGLPIIDNYNDFAIKNDMGLLDKDPFEPDKGYLDPRLDWTVGRRGLPFHDWGDYPGASWVLAQSYSGPYGPKKNAYWQATQDIYVDQSSWAPGTAINILIIRFADVLLMAAEAEAELGNLSEAQHYVNQVRSRAANREGWLFKYLDASDPMGGFSDTPAADYNISVYPDNYFVSVGKDKSLEAIYFERRIELAMEGHRFFDLSRWGNAERILNKYFEYEGAILTDVRGGRFIQGKNEYFPIPNLQIDLSVTDEGPLLKQNPGYR